MCGCPRVPILYSLIVNPILRLFFHDPKTHEAVKLKLSDIITYTSLRHILEVISVRFSHSCYHGHKITKGTPHYSAPQKSEILNNSVIYEYS